MLYIGPMITRVNWGFTAIEDNFAALPDLRWYIEHLVIEVHDALGRLGDTGTLRDPSLIFLLAT